MSQGGTEIARMLREIEEADRYGDRERVRRVRRVLQREFHVDAYRDFETGMWRAAKSADLASGAARDNDREERKRNAFAQSYGMRENRPSIFDQDLDELQRRMADAIREGRLTVPNPDAMSEARRRLQEYRSRSVFREVDWPYAGDWEVPMGAPPSPPPPELPPHDVSEPTLEETMAAFNESFKEETGT